MAEVLAVPPPDLTRIAERYDGFPRVGIAWKIDGRDPLVSHGGDMLLFGHVFGTMSEMMTDGSQTLVTRAGSGGPRGLPGASAGVRPGSAAGR